MAFENAYAKLGVTSRMAAVRIIRDHDAGEIGRERLA
jgi:DNA-binding CsgD family transcriptional regulator